MKLVWLAALILVGGISDGFADPSTLSGIDTSGISTPTATSICNMAPPPGNQATYNFYCKGTPGVATPKVGPVNPPVNMMNQMGQQMMMNAVQSLFQTDEKTPQQIESERQAALLRQQQINQKRQQEDEAKRVKEEADHEKLKNEMKLSGSTDSDDGIKRASEDPNDASFNHAGPDGNDIKRNADDEEKKDMPKKPTDAFNKGYEHATGCFSQNSMSACGAVGNDQIDACLADYRKGYQAGDKRQKLVMAEASRTGKQAGAAGELNNAASDSRADGPCRVQWIEAYGQGYADGAGTKNAR